MIFQQSYELADEDEPVRYAAFHFFLVLWSVTTFFKLSMFSYKVGDAQALLHMPQSRVLKRLERDRMSIDGKVQVATLALQADECEVQMKGLKVVLYAKFGKAISSYLDEWKQKKSPSFEMEKTLLA